MAALEEIEQFANAGKKRGSNKVGLDGWNCRPSEIEGVLGLANVRWAEQIIGERILLAEIYRKAGIKSVQDATHGLKSSWYKFTVRVPDADAVTRKIKELAGRVTQRTHGPDDAPPAGKFGFPVSAP